MKGVINGLLNVPYCRWPWVTLRFVSAIPTFCFIHLNNVCAIRTEFVIYSLRNMPLHRKFKLPFKKCKTNKTKGKRYRSTFMHFLTRNCRFYHTLLYEMIIQMLVVVGRSENTFANTCNGFSIDETLTICGCWQLVRWWELHLNVSTLVLVILQPSSV